MGLTSEDKPVVGIAMINVQAFGATGNYSTDDTAAIQAAADSSRAQLRPIQPSGGSMMVSQPELYFPPGKYKITGPIYLSPYQSVRGEDSLLVQQDPDQDIFCFTDNNGNPCGYQNRISGMQFVGGRRQINFSNANVDSTFLTVRDCQFQAWSEYSTFAEATVGDLHLSATILFDRCRWDGGTALYLHCDTSQISNSEVHFRGENIPQDSAWLVNKGVVGLNNITFVPEDPIVSLAQPKSVNAYWIENWGSVVCNRVRFSGEGAGIPTINHMAACQFLYPFAGPMISIENCQVSCGADADPKSAIVTLRHGFPHRLRISGCYGLVSNSIPIVRLDGYDPTDDMAEVSSSVVLSQTCSYDLSGNQFYVTSDVPPCMQSLL